MGRDEQADDSTPVAQGRTTQADDRLIGAVVADKYRVQSLVARGGMGRIYKAEQIPLGRVVALKILTPRYSADELDPQITRRFLLEAATCARLTHPNTVTVFDYGHMKEGGDDTFYMVMEFVEGRTLSRALREDGPFPPGRVLRVAREICRSLKEAHKLGIVHRDLKPGNVMLVQRDDGESVKVLDFGIAKVLQAGTQAENLTLEGNFLGSPKYMSPEQIRHLDVDARTDLYALGCVMYEMCCGRVPYDGETAVKTLMMHLQDAVPRMEERTGARVPPELEAVVRRCLLKDPNSRYADVDALREDIKAVARALGEDTGELSHERRVPPLPPTTSSEPTIQTRKVVAPPPARGGSGVGVVAGVLAIGVVAMVVVATVSWSLYAGNPDPVVPPPSDAVLAPVIAPPTPPDPDPPAAVQAVLVLESDPPGAEIWEGDQKLGTTPKQIEIDNTALAITPRRFVLMLDGYEPFEVVQGAAEGDALYRAPLVKKKRMVRPKTSPDDIRSER